MVFFSSLLTQKRKKVFFLFHHFYINEFKEKRNPKQILFSFFFLCLKGHDFGSSMYIPPEIEGQEAGVAQIAGIMKFLTYHEVNTVVARLLENIRDGNVQETKLNFALYFELVEDDLKHYLKKINYDQITET